MEKCQMLMTINDLSATYGQGMVLQNVSIHIDEGEIVTIIGNNGAGKSTLLKTISRLLDPVSGTITYRGKTLNNLDSAKVVRLGISQCPEGRRIFPRMSVEENLLIGSYTRKDFRKAKEEISDIYRRFPVLGERKKQLGGSLSGGEQQMLAIGRALMSRPKLLLLDEPSMGLMPILVSEVFKIIEEINNDGTTILLVEQNARRALGVCDRGYILETGRIVQTGTGKELFDSDDVRKAYLGETVN
jgi:branched-chain amino acid transport system ATP-binding protein